MQKNYFGAMIDMSRNAVMKVDEVKKYIDYLKDFGYNMVMLYTEDTYEIKEEPYFGYLRGRYSKEELKEIDAYCVAKDIELIPAIQTLAHLNCMFRWQMYNKIRDIDDILFAGEERTYVLIDNMFKTCAECFTSRKINIGFDEAYMLGMGKYFLKNGLHNKFEIFIEHLGKVIEIAKKYGFKPMMWSDMFFRMANNGAYYCENTVFTDHVKKHIPQDVDLVFWAYGDEKGCKFDSMMRDHKNLDNHIWFAGGASTWLGFAPWNNTAMEGMRQAMEACRRQGIEDIFITLWGDNGKETSYYSALPTLYYVKRIYDGETDLDKIKKEFYDITGESFDALVALELPNKLSDEKIIKSNPCKYLLYNDLFCGFLDSTIVEGAEPIYAKHAKTLKELGKNSKYKYIFDYEAELCSVMAIKYGMGLKLRRAYKTENKAELKRLVKELKTLEIRLEKFFYAFKEVWYRENKPFGFDVQDIRLGGLARRIRSCREDLENYLKGKLKELPELNEEILDFFETGEHERKHFLYNLWQNYVTVNTL